MSIQTLKHELATIRKGLTSNVRTLEELSKCDIHTLSDEELYRLIAGDYPGEPLAEVTDAELEAIINQPGE